MGDLYEVEIEPEVRSWLESLSDRDFGRVDYLVGLLAEQAETLGEPYTRHLRRQGARVAVQLAPPTNQGDLLAGAEPTHRAAHRLHKTRRAETHEVGRAIQAQKTCEGEHDIAHDLYERGDS